MPEDKIRTRYERNVPLIREAFLRADIGLGYDNSPLNSKPKLCLTFDEGHLIKKAAKLPKRISAAYREGLER